MKRDFIEWAPTNYDSVFDETTFEKPIIFILSTGVDPTGMLQKMAKARSSNDKNSIEFQPISMGRGQSEKAKRTISDGAEKGKWIFLANTHLSISLLPELEAIMEKLKQDAE